MVGMSAYYRDPILRRRKRKKPKPKKRAKRYLTLLLALLIGAYAAVALGREVPTGTVQLRDDLLKQVTEELVWPSRGQAAIGTLGDGVLARSHSDEQQRPIASLAKVITALAVLEKAPLQPGEGGITITFDASDEQLYHEYLAKDGSVTAVTAGASMNQYQALQAILLPSSNNMSDSLVRRVFGSVDAYVQYANDMIGRYGLTQTRVDDASGFSPHTTSTTSEMIAIGQKALNHPVIAEIVAQSEADIPLSGVIPNYTLIIDDEHVNGIKIGNTDEAGWCLLFSAKYANDTGKEATLIGVVLGEENAAALRDSSERLLASAKAGLRRVEVIRSGDVVGTYTTPWGAEAELVAQESLWAYGWHEQAPEFSHHKVSFPLSARQAVGSLQAGSDASVQVAPSSTVQRPDLLWRLRSGLSVADILRFPG